MSMEEAESGHPSVKYITLEVSKANVKEGCDQKLGSMSVDRPGTSSWLVGWLLCFMAFNP